MTTPTARRPIAWGRVAVLSLLLAEIAVAFAVGAAIGAGWTLLALAVLSLLGFWVLLHEGRVALAAFAGRATGTPADSPANPDATPARDTATGVAAGLLLVVPGFLTGLAGLLLLVPPVRQRAGRRVASVLARRTTVRRVGDVVVGEIVVTDLTGSDVKEPGTPGGPGSHPGISDR
jgi:UPF0716 protein FxsA